jgi:hypothetical protein
VEVVQLIFWIALGSRKKKKNVLVEGRGEGPWRLGRAGFRSVVVARARARSGSRSLEKKKLKQKKKIA